MEVVLKLQFTKQVPDSHSDSHSLRNTAVSGGQSQQEVPSGMYDSHCILLAKKTGVYISSIAYSEQSIWPYTLRVISSEKYH